MSGRWGSGGQALRVRGHMAKRCANGCGFLAAREAGQALRAGTIRHPLHHWRGPQDRLRDESVSLDFRSLRSLQHGYQRLTTI